MFHLTAKHPLRPAIHLGYRTFLEKPQAISNLIMTSVLLSHDCKNALWVMWEAKVNSCVAKVYPDGYLQGHTDQRRRAQGWRPHSVVGAFCCCWGLPSAQASGGTWGPRSAGPCTQSGDAPEALYPRCSSGSLASAAAAAHTSSTNRDRREVGVELGSEWHVMEMQ